MRNLMWPRAQAYLVLHAGIVVGISIMLLVLRASAVWLMLLYIPIYIAAYHYPRRLYLVMCPVLLVAAFIVELNSPPVHLENILGIVLGSVTIALVAEVMYHLSSAREKAQRALAANEAFHRAVIESSPLGISIRSRTGKLLSYNKAWKDIWAMPDKAILEDMTRERKELVFDERDRYLGDPDAVERVYQQGGSACLPDMKMINPRPGAAEWVSQYFYAITNEKGKVDRVVILTEDITDRKRVEQSEREEHALAEALRDAASALNSTLDFEEVLERILTNVNRVVPNDAVNIMLVEKGIASVIRGQGYAERDLEGALKALRWKVEDIPVFRQMSETAQPVVIPDTLDYADWKTFPESEWVHSYAGAPIFVKGQLVGFLNLDSAQPGFFTSRDSERLRAFADQAAVAIENARLYTELQERATEAAALYRASAQLIDTGKDVMAVAERITQLVTREFGQVDCGVLLVDPLGTFLTRVARSGDFKVTIKAPLSVNGPGLTVAAVCTGQLTYAPDVRLDARYISDNPETRSELDVPLVASGRVIGVLDLQSPELDAFDERARRIVSSFAESAGLALENARLYTEIQQLAIMDELTGLYNYRGLFELGQREVERARRFGRPLSALFIDIDSFGNFNKKYSHAIGNRVLRVIAERSRQNVRTVDLVARYGGEEFVILLPEADAPIAIQVSERLRKDIEATRIPTECGDLSVTVSIGAAELTPDITLLSVLLDRADDAEHAAKRKGGNCIEIFRPEVSRRGDYER
jgi:diguanylate cyclase (GGDEF)-like protein